MADLEGLRKVLEDGNLEQTLKVYHESLQRDFFGTSQDAQRAITMRKLAAMLGKKVKRMDEIRGVQGRHEELILNRTIDFQKDCLLLIDRDHWSKGVQARWVARIVSFEGKDIIQYDNLVGTDRGATWLQTQAKAGDEPMTANKKKRKRKSRKKSAYKFRAGIAQDELERLHRQLQQAIWTTNGMARRSTSEESAGGDGDEGEEMGNEEQPVDGEANHKGRETTPRNPNPNPNPKMRARRWATIKPQRESSINRPLDSLINIQILARDQSPP
jgi:hypothetical protein